MRKARQERSIKQAAKDYFYYCDLDLCESGINDVERVYNEIAKSIAKEFNIPLLTFNCYCLDDGDDFMECSLGIIFNGHRYDVILDYEVEYYFGDYPDMDEQAEIISNTIDRLSSVAIKFSEEYENPKGDFTFVMP